MARIDENGNLRTEESEMLIPTLRIIRDNPRCTMEFVKNELPKYMELYQADYEISTKSRPGEQNYRQICGNQRSHKKLSKFADIDGDTFILNSYGIDLLSKEDSRLSKDLLSEMLEEDMVISSKEINSMSELVKLNNRIPVQGHGSKSNRYATNPSLSKTVIENQMFICEYASLIGEKHETFDTKYGNKYLEAHHLIPMKAQKDFFPANLDRTENIIGLCPMCHAMIHHGNLNEKNKILKILYENRIDKLNKCNGNISISYENLINKYYL